GEAEDLPVREVPRHHGQHRPEWLVGDEAPSGFALARRVGEEAGGVVGVVAARPGALLRLGDGLRDRLAHLARHPLGVPAAVALQEVGHPAQLLGALLERGPPVAREGVGGAGEGGLDAGGVEEGVGLQRRAGGGVDGWGGGHRGGGEGTGWGGAVGSGAAAGAVLGGVCVPTPALGGVSRGVWGQGGGGGGGGGEGGWGVVWGGGKSCLPPSPSKGGGLGGGGAAGLALVRGTP